MEVHGVRQHIGGVQQRRFVLRRIRLPQDSAKDLLHIHGGSTIGQRRQYVGKGAVPALFQGVDRDDVSDFTIPAHQILPFEIIYVGRLYCNLVFRNAHTAQHCPDLIKGIAAVSGAGLRLKQNNGTNVFSTCRFCGNGFLFNAATELDGVLNDALPGGAIVHHHRKLHHVFLL